MVPVQLKEVGGVDLLVPFLLLGVLLEGLGKGVGSTADKIADEAAEAGAKVWEASSSPNPKRSRPSTSFHAGMERVGVPDFL